MEEFNNHTFAISAYKESAYLEECIKSVINQEVKSKIIIVTATPNEYIANIAAEYDIPVYIREGSPDIQDDWNYGYLKADTQYVTITHQDDIYNKNYSEILKQYVDDNRKQLIFFTDYRELKNGKETPLTVNLKIKKLMMFPLRFKVLRSNKFMRRCILSLGSPICCPTVTFNKEEGFSKPFTSEMKCSLDWDTWYKYSKEKGDFTYINKELLYHRIHEESETTNSIANNVRQTEDYTMFRKFWSKPIAKVLAKAYSKSLDTNEL